MCDFILNWLCSGQRVIVQEKNEDRVVENVVTIQVWYSQKGYCLVGFMSTCGYKHVKKMAA